MTRALAWTTLLLATTALAACGRGEPESAAASGDAEESTLTVSIGVGSLGFSRDSVRIRPEGLPEAPALLNGLPDGALPRRRLTSFRRGMRAARRGSRGGLR